MSRVLAALIATLALALVAGCGGDDKSDTSSAPAEESSAASANGCKDVEQPTPRGGGDQKKPTAKLDPSRKYTVTLATTCGNMTFRLDVKTSPNATASFVSLAKAGFFDDTIFHRIVPGFVIQGGDPTVTGNGGPGYKTVDKPPKGTTYPKGAVAMAKGSQEAPGTAGSQFYVVTGDSAQLPPDYAVLGKVASGMGTALKIDKLGDPNSGEQGTPLQSVVIESAKVHVSS